jgi:hypothetical protein
MTNGFIARLLPAAYSADATFGAGSALGIDPAFPALQLADPQPKAVLRTAAAPAGQAISAVVAIDLGSDQPIDVVAAMFTNLTSAATWAIWASTAAQGPAVETAPQQLLAASAFGVAPAVAGRRHALWTAPAPITRRYVRIRLNDTAANADRFVQLGLALAGRRLALGQGAYSNFELGSGRLIQDLSTIRTLPGGETYAERGARVPEWRATWSGVTEAEYREAWALLCAAGESAPVLAVEDPDAAPGQPEAMHYGLISGLEFTERVQIDKQRLTLRIREML